MSQYSNTNPPSFLPEIITNTHIERWSMFPHFHLKCEVKIKRNITTYTPLRTTELHLEIMKYAIFKTRFRVVVKYSEKNAGSRF